MAPAAAAAAAVVVVILMLVLRLLQLLLQRCSSSSSEAIWLDYGCSVAVFQSVFEMVVTGTYDLGTEFGLDRMSPVLVSELLPWLSADNSSLPLRCDSTFESLIGTTTRLLT